MNFVIRGEAILLGFLQGFFSQEVLFQDLPNEFRWVDNLSGLIIEMSESFHDETVNASPAIILQEGGWSEQIQSTGSNANWWQENAESHITPLYHPYTMHCISNTKSSAKLLQSATAKGIMAFRKAIYELGIDNISPLQGGPPMRLNSPDDTIPGYYDCTITTTIKMDQDWIVDRTGDPIEKIRFLFFMACKELTFDENGVPLEPVNEWIQQNISIDW